MDIFDGQNARNFSLDARTRQWLQATQPELCGKTPVILVPGFGASQIDCGGGAAPATPE